MPDTANVTVHEHKLPDGPEVHAVLPASLSVDGSGNLVYTATAGHVSALEFDETGPGTVTVHEVTHGGSMSLGFQTFGPFNIWRNGQRIDAWESPEAKTLVKVLLTL